MTTGITADAWEESPTRSKDGTILITGGIDKRTGGPEDVAVVFKRKYANLIKAAPDMFVAIVDIIEVIKGAEGDEMPDYVLDRLQSIVRKVGGGYDVPL